MSPKIFLTGGTGYIGGTTLDTIATAHPEYEVTVMLRKTPETFTTRYPNIKVIKGDYDSFDILADAAEKVDVVVHHGDSDHEPSINALIAGLLRRPTPGFLLHLSGTGICSDYHDESQLGRLNPKVWSDISSLPEIRALPNNALHRNTEKIPHATAAEHGDKIKIAIMCPPDIYGQGRGTGKTRSVYIPAFIAESKTLGGGEIKDARVFYVNEGTNTKSWVHIDDLAAIFLKVIEAAANGGGGAEWNDKGYYFTGTQEYSHLDIATATGKILAEHNIISNPEPLQVSIDEIDKMLSWYPIPHLSRYLFASNSRTKAERVTKLFGYNAKGPGLLESLEADVLDAVKSM
ncbi:NAD(P)-binding protein [Amniculicola lignicola CBS 123094]|uniref:NAD(P)-binding protein n=1 Tax=Amniculicola lignicola CBS 123094 TaxID=1392246 RepID=A0A6A5X582_9PLEO|nr:NAD(P)-binding protein [Amniculicola lignicola CBS 123094]